MIVIHLISTSVPNAAVYLRLFLNKSVPPRVGTHTHTHVMTVSPTGTRDFSFILHLNLYQYITKEPSDIYKSDCVVLV